jgi:hypothetical protein
MLKICVPHLPKKIEMLAVTATQTTNEFEKVCQDGGNCFGFALAGMAAIQRWLHY